MSAMPLRSWTIDEYLHAAEAGVFKEDERLELLDGQIIKMSPQGYPHGQCLALVIEWLSGIRREGFHTRYQQPMEVGPWDAPEPDVMVVKGSARQMRQHPTPSAIALVVEISDSSLPLDKGYKARLYGESGIPEYWIFDIDARALHVYREPSKSGYGWMRTLSEQEKIAPLFANDVTVAISDLLPDPD
jgi:Uma2 family endonuclease